MCRDSGGFRIWDGGSSLDRRQHCRGLRGGGCIGCSSLPHCGGFAPPSRKLGLFCQCHPWMGPGGRKSSGGVWRKLMISVVICVLWDDKSKMQNNMLVNFIITKDGLIECWQVQMVSCDSKASEPPECATREHYEILYLYFAIIPFFCLSVKCVLLLTLGSLITLAFVFIMVTWLCMLLFLLQYDGLCCI